MQVTESICQDLLSIYAAIATVSTDQMLYKVVMIIMVMFFVCDKVG